ncbi:MAG: hypothetical protein ACTMIR_11555, partial [Cellulomonadaceae bacterium]
HPRTAPGPGELLLGQLDLPHEQARGVATWSEGHLAIEGGPGSGRTGALRTLAAGALGRGWHVHAVAGAEFDDWDHAGLGTVVGADDPRRAAALLRHLAQTDGRAPRLLVLDDLEAVLAALTQMARGAGADALVAVLRRRTVRVALATGRALPSTLAPLVAHRLVLGSPSRSDDVARGVPADLAGMARGPGRGVWFARSAPLACQVALVDAPPPRSSTEVGADTDSDTGADGDTGALRLAAVPSTVHVHELGLGRMRTQAPAQVPVGRGGDHGGVLHLDVTRGALVVGPAGSGRSTALAAVGLGHGAQRLAVVAREGAAAEIPAAHRAGFGAADLDAVLALVTAEPASWCVIVDDAELLAQAAPAWCDRLVGTPGLRVVASASTSHAAGAVRGPLAALRATRTGIVLAPATPGSAEVFGTPLAWHTEPGPCPPGRGVLVHGRRLEMLQTPRCPG